MIAHILLLVYAEDGGGVFLLFVCFCHYDKDLMLCGADGGRSGGVGWGGWGGRGGGRALP